MGVFRLALKRENVIPILALLFATLVSVGLVLAHIARTGETRYKFLIWNLFLAWVPLVFAFLACHSYQNGSPRLWRVAGFGGTWLLFFPNSPYIFTDIIHLTTSFHRHYWIDLVLILSCALTGMIAGFISLYLMQTMIQRMVGRPAGWAFIGAVAGLSGLGVYIGRFLRLNSWDVIVRPAAFAHGLGKWLSDPSLGFPVLFATFFLITYLMLYALTHLQDMHLGLRTATARPQ